MTASTVFSIFNFFALIGWVIMIAGVVTKRPFLRDTLPGIWFPVMLSIAYTALIIFFFGQTEGGFDSLENVQKLFADPWVAVACWIHFLAFDIFIGARIARQTSELSLPRWPLIATLPLTFLFGPAGYLAFEAQKMLMKGIRT